MSDKVNPTKPDAFNERDRVWSDEYGFGTVVWSHGGLMPHVQVKFDRFPNKEVASTFFGAIITSFRQEHFPRTIFHAVADTHQGMRQEIALGNGLTRKSTGEQQ
jgi:hypothetical protein